MKIILRNVKGISNLSFDVPSNGVWIVTGLNGSGKTSLFAALYRLGYGNAFQRYFRAGPIDGRVDRYSNAEVEYHINDNSVLYKYGGQRWRATPNRNAKLIDDAPFTTVIYVEANANRIEPYPDEISAKRIKSCSDTICNFMHSVLGDPKWGNLKYVNTRRGGGESIRAYLIPYQDKGRTNLYFSERSFSLGELCVLRLATKILSVEDNSLVLVDEVEMALHPQAQVRLLQIISSIAADKNLTVLFSTHSSTLIKNCPKKNLIYLQQDAGIVNVQYSAFPAQILGEVAFDDELAIDFILYVEDQDAKILLEQMIIMYMIVANVSHQSRPMYKVIPVGGYREVISLLASTSNLFPPYVQKYALPDADSEASINDAIHRQKQPLTDTYNSVSRRVIYLPWTPELGIIDFLEQLAASPPNARQIMNAAFPGAAIRLQQIIQSADYRQIHGQNPRNVAKSKLNYIIRIISGLVNMEELHIRRCLYKIFVENTYAFGGNSLRTLLGPIFNVV